MYREIIRPTDENYMIKIPKEYLEQEVEILILPFSYLPIEREKKLKNIDPMIMLQTSSMQRTWENREDEAWDEL